MLRHKQTLLATVDSKEIEFPVTWDGLDAVNEARKSSTMPVLVLSYDSSIHHHLLQKQKEGDC